MRFFQIIIEILLLSLIVNFPILPLNDRLAKMHATIARLVRSSVTVLGAGSQGRRLAYMVRDRPALMKGGSFLMAFSSGQAEATMST